ncbi:glycerol-3-phosphate 1-O-acyltransferase PlsY [Thermaurantiacus sp.]
MILLAAFVLGYLLGSIPFGLILTRAAGGGDIRAVGSGNIGATNVLRTGKKGVALATLLLDAGKGVLAVWLAREFLSEPAALIAGLGAYAGHVWPVWLGFRGGKGVATFLGVATAVLPWGGGLAFALAWLLIARITRISSLGGMLGGFAATGTAVMVDATGPALLFLCLSLLTLYTHRDNIARLKAGTEPRIGSK